MIFVPASRITQKSLRLGSDLPKYLGSVLKCFLMVHCGFRTCCLAFDHPQITSACCGLVEHDRLIIHVAWIYRQYCLDGVHVTK